MARSFLRAALVASVVTFGASAALAQFGFIFGDPPPRPPGEVPRGGSDGRRSMPPRQYPPPPQYPSRNYPQHYPPQNYPGGPPQDTVRTRPLPPPDGTPQHGPADAAPPPQRPAARQPFDATPSPSEQVIAPSSRIVHPTALFSGLDKITGRIINFPVEVGETVQFGALQLTTRACYTRPPTESANTDAFVEIDEVTLQGEVKRIFTGWMFASSPGLHAVEHPIYDLWLTDCRGGTQVVAADGTPVEEPARADVQPKAQPKAQPKQVRPPVQRRPPQQPPPQNYPPFR